MENTSDQIHHKYWKSFESFANSDELHQELENEFMSSPLSEADGKDGWARREFLKLMGASLALSSFGCVRRPVQRIVPYAKAPLEIVPGVSNYYSSSFVQAGEGYGLIVKTREGRPTKLEGNPLHPSNQGALSARAQAHILSLYDPDRLQKPKKVDRSNGALSDIAWEAMDEAVLKSLASGEVAILSSSLGSPTTNMVIADFLQAFKGRHVTWDPTGPDDVLEGQRISFGKAVMPRYRFEKARMVVSIDCDFLGTFGAHVENARNFSKVRKVGPEMAQLVSFESILTITGSSSDTRVRIKPSQQVDVALGLLGVLVKKGQTRFAGNGSVASLLPNVGDLCQRLGIETALFEQIATDLWENRGRSIVLAGGLPSRTSQSVALQVAVNLLNSALENEGKTIDGQTITNRTFDGSSTELAQLITDMKAGKIKTLIIHRVNPVYALAPDSGFIEALAQVPMIIYTGDRADETGKRADFIAPDVHDLENWGDTEIQSGVYSIQQPMIRPMYDNSPFQFTLMNWATVAKKGPQRLFQDSWYKYFRQAWEDRAKSLKGTQGFDSFWTKLLQDGVYDSHSGEARTREAAVRAFNTTALSEIRKASASSGVELVLYPTVQLGDGTYANIAWLQELPDPITKVVWDSYLCVSPKYAAANGLKSGDMVEVKTGSQTVKVPAFIQPGYHDEVVGLAVGYGRSAVGTVGNGIGVNAFQLASFRNGRPVFSGLPVSVSKTGAKYPIATTQDHNSMEGRQIIVQATLAQYLQKKNANIREVEVPLVSVWKKHEYKGYRWGMAIDQTACIGCSACVIACQAENNIPVVGKRFILNGREMHWIRIDRYYAPTTESTDATVALANPDVLFQPMLCQHCETAPCETVCPVAATVHDDQGLNTMIYNRCVGTRYCSNNCPYKVRRFNWFNYNIEENPYTLAKKPLNKQLNPEVTVRFRGVMEKCTFCIHRIDEAKNTAKDNNTVVKDGDMMTACEQTCPTNAIVFGDLNDPTTRVSQLHKDERTYRVLEELNTRPAIRYMTRIRNAKRATTSETTAEQKGKHS